MKRQHLYLCIAALAVVFVVIVILCCRPKGENAAPPKKVSTEQMLALLNDEPHHCDKVAEYADAWQSNFRKHVDDVISSHAASEESGLAAEVVAATSAMGQLRTVASTARGDVADQLDAAIANVQKHIAHANAYLYNMPEPSEKEGEKEEAEAKELAPQDQTPATTPEQAAPAQQSPANEPAAPAADNANKAPAAPAPSPAANSREVVRSDSEDGYVNVRQSTNTKSPIIGKLTNGGQTATYLGQEDGWYKVRLNNGTVGYVYKKYAALGRGNGGAASTSGSAASTPARSSKTLVRCNSSDGFLNVRESASTQARVVGKLTNGGSPATLIRTHGSWLEVRTASGTVGFVDKRYTTLVTSAQ